MDEMLTRYRQRCSYGNLDSRKSSAKKFRTRVEKLIALQILVSPNNLSVLFGTEIIVGGCKSDAEYGMLMTADISPLSFSVRQFSPSHPQLST